MKSDDVRPAQFISIHALRVEGDQKMRPPKSARPIFLSTPSGWRATMRPPQNGKSSSISIHALRVEGDPGHDSGPKQAAISIHALRVEGDQSDIETLFKN